MFVGAIASFLGAAILALLVALGMAHARRTVPERSLITATPTPAI
jgi:hypothetical protein